MKLFHATTQEALPKILEEGLKTNFGELYCSDSAEGAARWVLLRKSSTTGIIEVPVVEFTVSKKYVAPGIDHSPVIFKLLNCGPSFVLHSGVAPWKIKGVHTVTFQMKTLVASGDKDL